MNREHLIRIFDQAIKTIILAIVALVPLYFNIFVFITFQKVDFFEILSQTAVLLFVFKIIIEGRIKMIQNRFFYFSFIFILASQILATLFSAHPYESFWGWRVRQIGVYTWLNVFLFSLIVFYQVHSKLISVKQIFITAFFSGSIISVYALMQVAGFEPIHWSEISNNLHIRAISTLGQPNFLGSFLLALLPVTYFLIVNEKYFYRKSFYLTAIILQFTALLATYSRGAWLALVATLSIFAGHYIWKKNRKIFFGTSLVFLSVVIAFFIWAQRGDYIIQMQLGAINRLKSIVRMNEGSVGMRGMYYQAAWDLIKKRPLIGYGLDNQIFYFYKYYNPDYAIFERVNISVDRAHNELLDILFTTGIIGASAWLFFYYVLIVQARRYFMKSEKREGDLAVKILIFAIIAVTLSVFFSFYTESYLVYLWVYTGILFAIFSYDKNYRFIEIDLRKGIKILLLIAATALYAFALWNINIRSILADYSYQEARKNMLKREYKTSVENFSKMVEYVPKDFYYRNRMVGENLSLVLDLDDGKERRFALEYLKNILLEFGNETPNFEGDIYLAIVRSEIGRIDMDGGKKIEDIGEFRESEKLFLKVLEENKQQARVYLDFGNLYFYERDFIKAIEVYEKALSLYPDMSDKRMNDEHRLYVANEKILVYKKIIEAEINMKDFKKAVVYSNDGLKLSPFDMDLWQKLGLSYYYDGDIKKSIKVFEHLSVIYPNDDFVYFQLASAYKQGNDIDSAEEAIKKAILLNPGEKKYAEFLVKL